MISTTDIIQACIAIIEKDGVNAVSIRHLADFIGVDAPQVYKHFSSKGLLLNDVYLAALEQFRHSLQDATADRQGLKECMIATCMSYLEFAEQHPALFELLFQGEASRKARGDAWASLTPESLRGRLQGLMGMPCAYEDQFLKLWPFVHGTALLLQSHLQGLSESAKALTVQHIEMLLEREARLDVPGA